MIMLKISAKPLAEHRKNLYDLFLI